MRESFVNSEGKYVRDKKNEIRLRPVQKAIPSHIYIGETDATSEWQNNKDLAKHMFLHTSAYSDFCEDNALILLGRTGAGKSSILLCIEDDIRTHDKYAIECAHVVNINCDKLLESLLNGYNVFSVNDLILSNNIKEIIRIFVKTVVMAEICENPKGNSDLHDMQKFLKNCGLINQSNWINFIQTFLSISTGTDFHNNSVNTGIAIANSVIELIKQLRSKGFSEAEKNLQDYLNINGRVIVLMDSLNRYDMKNKELVIIVKCLIETCFYFYNEPKEKILVKIALPAEVYNKVLVRLPAKMDSNTVVIQWKTKDLVTLLALRIFSASYFGKIPDFDFNKDYSFASFYSDIEPRAYENAIKYISNILPKLCPNSLNVPFLTLAYCLRHTLKKPREIICMFNEIIDVIVKNNDSEYLINHPESIHEIVHSTQDYMIHSALGMYAETYPSIYAAVQYLFYNKYFVINGLELKKAIKEAVSIARKLQNDQMTVSEHMEINYNDWLDESELVSVILESGLVGTIMKTNIVQKNNHELKNDEPFCMLVVNFNFDVSSTFIKCFLPKEDQYVVHPMLYECCNCSIDKNTIVYPGNDDSDNLINTIINIE